MARSTVANNIGNNIPRRILAANFLTCSPVLHNILQARAVTDVRERFHAFECARVRVTSSVSNPVYVVNNIYDLDQSPSNVTTLLQLLY